MAFPTMLPAMPGGQMAGRDCLLFLTDKQWEEETCTCGRTYHSQCLPMAAFLPIMPCLTIMEQATGMHAAWKGCRQAGDMRTTEWKRGLDAASTTFLLSGMGARWGGVRLSALGQACTCQPAQ